MAVSSNPGRTAVVDGALRLTREELSGLVDGGAGVIAASGAEYVAYVGTGGIDLPLLIFSCARAGAAFAPLNYRLSHDGLCQLIDRLPRALAVVDHEYRDLLAGGGKQVVTVGEFIDAAGAADPVSEFSDPDAVAV